MADYTLSVEINGDASSMENAFKKVSGALENTKSKINNMSSETTPGIGKMVKSFGIAQLAVKGFSMAMGAVSGAVGGAVSRVDTLNQFPKVLQQMGYKSEEARASIKTLSDGIKGLPTTLDGIAGNTQRMITIMGDVPKATQATLALNDAFLASGASGETASRGLEQYLQMLSSGKVDMMSWRTLQETMPYALKRTAEAFGFTGKSATNDFYDALKKGKITMDDVTNKFIELNKGAKGWHNTALDATKGMQTSFVNLQAAITRGVGNVIQSINDWGNANGFGDIASNVDKVKQKVSEAFGYIVQRMPEILDKVKVVAGEFQKWYERLKPFAPVVLAVLTPLLAFKGVVSIAQGVTDGVNKITGAVNGLGQGVEIIKGVPGAFSVLKGSIGSAFSKIVMGNKIMYSMFTFIADIPIKIAGAFQSLWAVLAANPIILIIAGIVAVVGALIYCYKHFEGFRNFVNNVANSIKDFFINAWDTIKTTTVEVWNGLKTTVITVVQVIKDTVIAIFNGLKTGVSNVINGIKIVFTTIFNAIKTTVINIANGLVNGAIAVFNGLKTGVQNIVNKVKSIFNALRNINLLDIGKKIINGFLRGLKAAFENVKSFIGGIGDWIREHKGPIQVDKKLLIPAGNAIMYGFNNGLNSGFDTVKSTVLNVGNTIQGLLNTDTNTQFELDLEDNKMIRTLDKARNMIRDFKEYAEKGFSLNARSNVSENNEMKRVVVGATGVFNQNTNTENTGRNISTDGVQSVVVRELGDLNLTVTSEMDSREVARGTYKFTDEFLKRNQKIRERRRGELY